MIEIHDIAVLKTDSTDQIVFDEPLSMVTDAFLFIYYIIFCLYILM